MDEPRPFTGTWHIVSSPDFEQEYLAMEVEPYVRLREEGGRVVGDYQVGVQTGLLYTSDVAYDLLFVDVCVLCCF